MEKGYESILKVLENGESIIYKTDKNFKFGEKNSLILGEKIFCISNLGKIFIADKNKRLKGIKVFTYDHREKNTKFKVLTKDNVIAINSREFTDVRAKSFIINMRMDDFINICNKLDDNPFIIEWSKYVVKLDDGLYESAGIDLYDEEACINIANTKINLKYDEVVDIKIVNNSIHIMTSNNNFYSILIYCFNKNLEDITSKIDAFKSLQKKDELICNEENDIDKTQIMTYSDIMQEISVEIKPIESDEETISNYYKNEFVANTYENNSNFDKIIEKNENEDEIKQSKEILVNLYGTVNEVHYKAKKVSIVLYNEEIKIIDVDLNKEILDSLLNSLELKVNGNNIICKKNNEIFLLEIIDGVDIELPSESVNESTIVGYTDQKQPFVWDLIKNVLNFIQGENYNIESINIADIADINILDSQYNFDAIALTLKDSSVHKLLIERKNIKLAIESIYKVKSTNILNNLADQELRLLYLNCKKDKLTTIIFSGLNKIKILIDNYYKLEEKNRKELVTDVFSAFENIQNSCELASMYYLQEINCENSQKFISIKNEFKSLIREISFKFNNLEKIFKTINIFNQPKNIYYRKVSLNSDMNETLEGMGINIQSLTNKEIFVDMEIDDYKFDIIMSEISDELNNIIMCYMPYYFNCIDDIFYQMNELNFHIGNKEYKDEIIRYFVDMQFKSRLDGKCRLKEILNVIKKYKVFKCVEVIDILNLVNFK